MTTSSLTSSILAEIPLNLGATMLSLTQKSKIAFFSERQFDGDTLKHGTALVFNKSTVPIVPTVSRTRKVFPKSKIFKRISTLKNLLKFQGFYLKDKVVMSVSRV